LEAFLSPNSDPEVMRQYTGDDMLSDIDHAREIMRPIPASIIEINGFGCWACLPVQRLRTAGPCRTCSPGGAAVPTGPMQTRRPQLCTRVPPAESD